MTEMILLSTWMESQVEFWRKTQYEGYDVSNFGRVRSWIKKKSATPTRLTPLMLKIAPARNGKYPTVALQGKTRTVHRVVAETFLPNPFNWPLVNHKTGNKSNSHLGNLEWKTRSGNLRHAFDVGLRSNIPKKLTDALVREIQIGRAHV